MTFSSRVLAKITSGMLIARPMMSSGMLPLATAATPITLSRLMTRSAIRMVRMAVAMSETAAPVPSPSSSGSSNCTAIHSSSRAPINLSTGNFSSSTATMVSTMRIATAALLPQKIALFC